MQEKKFKFVGDRENATYRAELYLENGKTLDGYSKHTNHDEPIDKEKCLVGYVGRILSNGYLSRCQYIAFYTNKKLGKQFDDTLLELTVANFTLSGSAEMMFDLRNFLNQFYSKFTKGHDTTALKPVSSKSFSPQLFEIKGQFRAKSELDKYCEVLKNKGVPYGRVQGYYYAYLKIHPLDAQPQVKVEIENLIGSNLSHMINR